MAEAPRWKSPLGAASPYLGLGMQLAATMVFYVALGYGVDYFFGTGPWFLLVGAVLGMVAFFLQLMRVVKRLDADSARKKHDALSEDE